MTDSLQRKDTEAAAPCRDLKAQSLPVSASFLKVRFESLANWPAAVAEAAGTVIGPAGRLFESPGLAESGPSQ